MMQCFLRPLRARKLPVAAGVFAVFGSLWLTCKDQFYFSNSYSSLLWQYFVPGFLKSNTGADVPGKQPKNQSIRLPHIQIRKNEQLIPVNIGFVSHYETCSLASNEPMEDRNSEYSLPNGVLFGVFDGHSGWQCAEEVMKRLPYYVSLSMAYQEKIDSKKLVDKVKNLRAGLGRNEQSTGDLFGKKAREFCQKSKELVAETASIEEQLKNAFKLLDEDISFEALPEVNGFKPVEMMKGISGACAITAYVHNSDIYVASSGDCRAVLGSKGPDGKWHATSLSMDQNVFNENEVKRLKMEHPGENHVIVNGRLLGHLQPLRAFGDVIFKWDAYLHKQFLNQIYGRVMINPQIYITPPYLTAEPVVTHHNLRPGDKFLVIATDGLWDMKTNDEVVQCVGALLESDGLANESRTKGASQVNGASQLIQEALGGTDELKVSRLLSAPKQIRRALRDDITVTVVYFDQKK